MALVSFELKIRIKNLCKSLQFSNNIKTVEKIMYYYCCLLIFDSISSFVYAQLFVDQQITNPSKCPSTIKILFFLWFSKVRLRANFLRNLQTLCPLRSIWMLLSIPFTKAYSGRVFMIHFLSFFLLPSFLLSTQAFDRGSSSTAMVWMVVSEEVYFPVGRSALFLGGLLPQLSTEKALNWGPNLQRFFVAKRAKRTL